MLTRRQFLGAAIALGAMVATPSAAWAFPGDKHDGILKTILLGREAHLSEQEKKKLLNLNDASYLCLDQFNGYGKKKLEHLADAGVSGLPNSLEEINYRASGDNHREYTHRGWDYSYEFDRANWCTRKKILLETVNAVFDFGFLSEVISRFNSEYSERCQRLSELIYCVHVLGDHVEAIESKSMVDPGTIMPLAGAKDGNDLFTRIGECFRVLFSDQHQNLAFKGFESERATLLQRANATLGLGGNVREGQYDEYSACVEGLQDLLIERAPKLFQKEAYFKAAFPQSS